MQKKVAFFRLALAVCWESALCAKWQVNNAGCLACSERGYGWGYSSKVESVSIQCIDSRWIPIEFQGFHWLQSLGGRALCHYKRPMFVKSSYDIWNISEVGFRTDRLLVCKRSQASLSLSLSFSLRPSSDHLYIQVRHIPQYYRVNSRMFLIIHILSMLRISTFKKHD